MNDLKNKKFGKLLVIRQVIGIAGKITWLCKCECGNETVSRTSNLVNGTSTSCGCSRAKSLIGSKFGKLTVKKRQGSNHRKYATWECLCDCGNTITVVGSYLRNGDTKSCGCSSNNKPLDLTNIKFFKLTALTKVGRDRHYNILWDCLCECGNKIIVSTNSLRRGNTKSCGCLQHPSGKDNPMYNHNLTDEDRRLGRKIPGYAEWRLSVFERDESTCQCCNKKGGKLQAHHIKAYSRFPDLRLDIDNGATLCKKCHKKFHKLYGMKRFTSDDYYEFLKERDIIYD